MAWDNRTHGGDVWTAPHEDKWAINADDDYTIAFFIKVTDSTANKKIVSHGISGDAYWNITLQADNAVRVVLRGVGTLFVQNSTFTYTDNQLHMIAIRVKNSTLDVDIFLDDAAPENYTMASTINADSANPLSVGELQGVVYWLAIWDTALSDSQIKGLYAGGVPVLHLAQATNWSNLIVCHECNELSDGETGPLNMAINDVSQYQTQFTNVEHTPDYIGGPYAVLGVGPLIVQAPAVVVGGPFPHYIRRRQRGGMIGMGV